MGEQLRQSAEQSSAALVRDVGARVRALRQGAGLPRRVLSERSGVSHRFLAQLEAGEGNISIARLHQIAQALGRDLAELLVPPDAADIAQQFALAAPEVRAQVRQLLSPAPRARRVCLIGLRGAGKSSLGAHVAARLNVPFVELTQVIASLAGMPPSEVIALYGDAGYRALEARAVSQIVETHDRVLLAAAGGIVGQPPVFDQLLAAFHAVWLSASPQEHMDRVRAQGDLRPMAGNPAAMAQLKSLLTDRAPQYARAQMRLDTAGRSFAESARELEALLHGLLHEPAQA